MENLELNLCKYRQLIYDRGAQNIHKIHKIYNTQNTQYTQNTQNTHYRRISGVGKAGQPYAKE